LEVLREFFPDDAQKFVDEAHTCQCSVCLKEFSQMVNQHSTELSSNPNQQQQEGNLLKNLILFIRG
jgi:uncharacterized metal-binding protein YceD (DUF177 family)